MDTYTYMTSGPGHKYRALWDADEAPPFHPRHRQRDVNQHGQAVDDLRRALGQTEWSRTTGESREEYCQRTGQEPTGA